MAFYYLYTSALVKLYVREPGTERMLALAARSSENRLAVLALAQVELRSAVRRRTTLHASPFPVVPQHCWRHLVGWTGERLHQKRPQDEKRE